jgi:hypothetical protein
MEKDQKKKRRQNRKGQKANDQEKGFHPKGESQLMRFQMVVGFAEEVIREATSQSCFGFMEGQNS